ncbi:bifunctional 3'-5' exonuclease/ATP-dependent helicase WRN [Narcine bancroftii]|uniref:bifunctional 3'-5' exonuclease/ATP-dependent helicase WRN n=1 Tax=Narcine bancroftii TaxID=1343680 RepID=UPI00383113BA
MRPKGDGKDSTNNAIDCEKMTNQQRMLPEWMVSEEIEDTNKHLKTSYIKKNILEDKLPFLQFPGSIIYSYEGNDCSFLSEDLRLSISSDSAIGFDLEWPPTYIKGKENKVALIQLCASEKKCYLFHVSAMSGFPSGLKRLLEDKKIKKVGVGINGDQWKLMRDYDIKLKSFVELTEMANQKLNCAEKWSLNGLVKHLHGKQLWKDPAVRCSNWDTYPLSDEQQQYAASDAYAGLLIYQKLNSLDIGRHNKDDRNLHPFPILKSNLISIAHELQYLAQMVPDLHSNSVHRAKGILNVISENVSDLRNILLESASGIGALSGIEAKTELLGCNQVENNCSENNLKMIEMANSCYQELDQKSNLTEMPLVPHNANVGHVQNLESQIIDQNDTDVNTGGSQNKRKDYLMSLDITEYEIQMLERQAQEEDAVNNAISSLPNKALKMDEEADDSYVIESDEELESEMVKVLQDLDNCSEMDSEESLKLLDKTASEDYFGVEDEVDETIKEEKEKWDVSIPKPNEKQIKCLKTYFGHSNFKPVQWNVIYSVLQERRDNLVVMATGYGKSLCYQFPAVYTGGVTVVVSPLISLMEDQVLQLNMSNITACFLGSAQSQKFSHELIKGHFKVVYMTPEYCSGSISLLKKLDDSIGITLIAVDEAHCISEWGHDFRSSYRKLGSLKQFLPQVPVIALTATASPSIRSDIMENLKLTNPQVVCTTFDRPNLYLEVGRKSTDIKGDLKPFLVKRDKFSFEFEGPTIIYCPTRKATELVAGALSQMNVVCGTYHAGMGIKARRDVHHKFMRDEIQCVVATIAFGMGINKSDIRKVIHYGAPKEMESYYQEIGRAGRDGLPSACHVLWSPSDMMLNRQLLNEIKSSTFHNYKIKMMEKMKKYLTSSKCRRNIILSHFEDEELRKASLGIIGTDQCCDNCRLSVGICAPVDDSEDEMQDFGTEVYQLLTAICILGETFGIGVPVLFLRGSYSQRLPERHRNHHLFGSGKKCSENWWKTLGHQLITECFLQERSSLKRFAVTIALTMKGQAWLKKAADPSCRTLLLPVIEELRLPDLPKSQVQHPISPISSERSPALATKSELQNLFLLDQFAREKRKENEKPFVRSAIKGSPVKTVPSEPALSPRELEWQGKLYGKLLAARQNIASEKDVPPALLATNKILLEFAKIRPTTVDNLKRIDGVSVAKSAMLAPLLNIIKKFCEANELEMDKFSVSTLNIEQNPVVQPNSAFGVQSNIASVTKARTRDSSNVIFAAVGNSSSCVPKSGNVDVNQAEISDPVQNHSLTSDFNWESVQTRNDDNHPGQSQNSCVETKFPQENDPAFRFSEPCIKEEINWIDTAEKPTDTQKPSVLLCSQNQTAGCSQRSISPDSFVSWNDASTRDLFDDSQSEGQAWLKKAADPSCRTLLLPVIEELRLPDLPKSQVQHPISPISSERSPALATKSELQNLFLLDQFAREKRKENEKPFVRSAIKGSPVKTVPSEPALSPRELEWQGKLYGKLLAARQNIASEKDVPPALLATNKILLEFAKIRPTTVDNLKRIDGVSVAKSAMLAPLLNIIKKFCEANELEMDKFSVSTLNIEQNPVVQPNSAFGVQSNIASVTKARTRDSSNVIFAAVGNSSSCVPKSGNVDVNQAEISDPVQNHSLTSDFNWESVQTRNDDNHPGQSQNSCVETKFPQENDPAFRFSEPCIKEEINWIDTAEKPTDTQKPSVLLCSQNQTAGCSQRSISPDSFVSWNDASTRDLFDDSQSEGQAWLKKAADPSCRTLLLPVIEELRLPDLPKSQVQHPISPISSERSPALATKSELQNLFLLDQFAREKRKENEKPFVRSAIKGSPVKTVPSEPALSPRELEWQGKLYGKLLAARQNIASEKDVPPALLATNKILLEFAKIRPTTVDNLKRIDGVSVAKSAMLAPLLNIIKKFCEANELEMDKFSVSTLNIEQNPVVQPNSAFGVQSNIASVTKARTRDSSNVIFAAVGNSSSCVPKSGNVDVNQAEISDPVQNHSLTSDFNWESVQTRNDDNHPGQSQNSCVETKFPQENDPAFRFSEPCIKEEINWIDTAEKPTDTQKPSVLLCSQNQTAGCSQRSISPDSFVSWNDASTRDLFDDSQSESCSQSTKRKIPEWFESSKPQAHSCIAKKKAKKGKGIFN